MTNYLRVLIGDVDDRDGMFKDLLHQFHCRCKVKNLSEKTLSVYGEMLHLEDRKKKWSHYFYYHLSR